MGIQEVTAYQLHADIHADPWKEGRSSDPETEAMEWMRAESARGRRPVG
jgi:hypothetical protein